jgi:hypothetical protein
MIPPISVIDCSIRAKLVRYTVITRAIKGSVFEKSESIKMVMWGVILFLFVCWLVGYEKTSIFRGRFKPKHKELISFFRTTKGYQYRPKPIEKPNPMEDHKAKIHNSKEQEYKDALERMKRS